MRFRDDLDAAKAEERRQQLLHSLKAKRFDGAYTLAEPCPENRFSFRPENVSPEFCSWPSIADLAMVEPYNGPIERRGQSLIRLSDESAALIDLVKAYLDPDSPDSEVEALEPRVMKSSGEFKAAHARLALKGRVSCNRRHIARYPIRPFDMRIAYLDPCLQPLFSRPSPELLQHRFEGNGFLVLRETSVKNTEYPPIYYSRYVCDYHTLVVETKHVPIRLMGTGSSTRTLLDTDSPYANLSKPARAYLAKLGVKDHDSDAKTAGLIWMHALAIGYSPAYLTENADGIRRDWPRVPLPAGRKALEASAALGEQVAALLDTETEVRGVTTGKIGPFLKTIGLVSKVGGGSLDPSRGDLEVTAGWGHAGKGGVTMPGKGTLQQRAYDEDEAKAIDAEAKARGMSAKEARRLLGDKTCDVYLNETAYWRNIPLNVWEYHIGGYQVIKKWLSYRELKLLGRSLKPKEVREVMNTARRIAAIILLQPKLDKNYHKAKAAAFDWAST